MALIKDIFKELNVNENNKDILAIKFKEIENSILTNFEYLDLISGE